MANERSASEGSAQPPLSYERPGAALRHSRRAKWSFGLAMFMVVYFFIVYSFVEPFLLAAQAGSEGPITFLWFTLLYVCPIIGMGVCAGGFLLGWSDLRKPERSRDYAWMGLTISAVIFLAFVILMILSAAIL